MTDLKTTEIDAARYWDFLEKRIRYNGTFKEDLIQLSLFAIALSCLPSSDPLIVKISSPHDVQKPPKNGREIINTIKTNYHNVMNNLQDKHAIACDFFNINQGIRPIFGGNIDQICSGILNDICEIDIKTLKSVFEYGFTQTQTESKQDAFEIEYYSSHFAATIAQPNTLRIIDAFGKTCEFALQVFKNTGKIDAIWLPFSGGITLNSLLRLIMHGIKHDSIIVGTDNKVENIQFDISICGTSGYSNLYRRQPEIDPNHAYDAKLSPGYFASKSKLSLVVAPLSDAVRHGGIKLLRQNIFNNENLLAITNLPHSLSKLSSRTTIWITENKKAKLQDAKKPVAIDINSISHLTLDNSKHDLCGFIARLLSLAHPESINDNLGANALSRNKMLNQLFFLAFKYEYRNIPGFCQRINPERIPEANYSFSANSYIERQQPEPWLSGLDYANILNEIKNEHPSKPLNIYIIGDNGQGKSMLLQDFITNQSTGFAKILAISNGTHDRFPKRSNNRYKYLGNASPSNQFKTKQDAAITDSALGAFKNAENNVQWGKIQNILQTIGVSPEFYLMHPSAQITKNNRSGDLASIITFPPRSDFDAQGINNIISGDISSKDYHLGVSLLRDENAITKFTELSSGEQNILSIIFKIAAHVENNSLILIDEPEISLHVSWQRMLPRIIEQLTESYSAITIIATHSPIIIAEASGENDRCYSAENRETRLIEKHNKRSIESLMFESFKTHTINNREVHEKCAQLLRESIEIANANEKNLDTIESNIKHMKEMQAIIANNKNIQSANAASFQNDQIFIDSVIDALERIKAHITDQK